MRFRLNDAGVERFVNGAPVVRHLEHVADDVKRAVEVEAERFARTHFFARSIRRTGVVRTFTGLRATVYSVDFARHWIEFGSRNNPAYAPVRKAISALRLRLRPGRPV